MTTRRPACPRCGEDELYVERSFLSDVVVCYVCGWRSIEAAEPRLWQLKDELLAEAQTKLLRAKAKYGFAPDAGGES